jgi:hypothetical protein
MRRLGLLPVASHPPQLSYVGLDIVPGRYSCESGNVPPRGAVRFKCSDFLSQPPPGGDLLLIKDVIQHLSNACIHDLIRDVLPRFRYTVITNDVRKYEKWPQVRHHHAQTTTTGA